MSETKAKAKAKVKMTYKEAREEISTFIEEQIPGTIFSMAVLTTIQKGKKDFYQAVVIVPKITNAYASSWEDAIKIVKGSILTHLQNNDEKEEEK